jgi:hypothetical protein
MFALLHQWSTRERSSACMACKATKSTETLTWYTLSALKIRLILWKNCTMYRPKKVLCCFQTFQIFFDSPTYVKKLNYPNIWHRKWNLHSGYAVCLLLVTKLNRWPNLPVMFVTKLDHHSIWHSLSVICVTKLIHHSVWPILSAICVTKLTHHSIWPSLSVICVTKLTQHSIWPILSVICVTELTHHSIWPSLSVICVTKLTQHSIW